MSEEQLQRQTAQFLCLQHRDLLAWHTPNGGHRVHAVAAKLAGQGVLPGVADWTFVLPSGLAAFIELKWGGNSQTAAQREFEATVTQRGCPYEVASSLEEFLRVLKGWQERGLLHDPALPFDIRNSVALRSRGIPTMKAPWAALLQALSEHLNACCDCQFYTQTDARILELIARTVRERADRAEEERARRHA